MTKGAAALPLARLVSIHTSAREVTVFHLAHWRLDVFLFTPLRESWLKCFDRFFKLLVSIPTSAWEVTYWYYDCSMVSLFPFTPLRERWHCSYSGTIGNLTFPFTPLRERWRYRREKQRMAKEFPFTPLRERWRFLPNQPQAFKCFHSHLCVRGDFIRWILIILRSCFHSHLCVRGDSKNT